MKRLTIILLFCVLTIAAFADVVVTLNSGQQVAGTIVFQNQDVVVIKSQEGQRFQYPMSEVRSITEGEIEQEEEDLPQNQTHEKKVGVALHISGGAGIIPSYSTGGSFGANVYIGACNLMQKHIFVGGGLGVDMFFFPTQAGPLVYIPLQAHFSAPFMQTKHAPAAACSIGYGFSTKGIDKGGLSAVADFGWRCQLSSKAALFAGLSASIQQGKIDIEETIESETYTHSSVRSLWKVGAKLAIQF